MTLTPEQIRTRENYLKLEVELGCIADDAQDALELTRTLADVGYVYVPDLARLEAAEKLPKAIRQIEVRLRKIKKRWSAK